MFGKTSKLGRICQLTGACVIGYHFLYTPGLAIYNYLIVEPYNLKERYGEGSWAVITGASDGIGRAFVNELAKNGFNIYMISRTEAKLVQAQYEIEQLHNVKVKYLTKDFSKSLEDGFFDDILQDTEDLDVSILVNNVGTISYKKLTDDTKQELKDLMVINMYPATVLTREFAPRMMNRKEKSAVINLSSAVATQPFSIFPAHTGTKAYIDYFSRACSYDFE